MQQRGGPLVADEARGRTGRCRRETTGRKTRGRERRRDSGSEVATRWTG